MANPVVTIEMENGDIMKAELYPEIAPNTVNNFVSLVNKGFYNGLIFPSCDQWIHDPGRMSVWEMVRAIRATVSMENSEATASIIS